MSEHEPLRGPPMVVATSVMKPPPLRVGKLANGVTLPRPVQLKVLLAALAGGIVGAVVSLIFGVSFNSFMWAVALFGGMGVTAVTYSPLQGESLTKWLRLTFGTRRRANFTVDGRPARVAVGIAPIADPVRERSVHLSAGSVRVPPTAYDERGVRLPTRPMPAPVDSRPPGTSAVTGYVAPPHPTDSSAAQPLRTPGGRQ
jgi:hypothetical protein